MRPSPFRFPRSIATVSLPGTLPEKLEAAASVGFNGVELFENDLLTFDGASHFCRLRHCIDRCQDGAGDVHGTILGKSHAEPHRDGSYLEPV